MKDCPKNTMVGFVGPFDAIIRSGDPATVNSAIEELATVAADHGLHMGRVCGSGTCTDPADIEEAMVKAINGGFRIISVHYLASEMSFVGTKNAAAPFWKAAARCGF